MTITSSKILQQLGVLTSCWGVQDLPQQLDRAAQRAELERRVAGMPFAMPEIVRHTRDEDLYFSVIADRCGALSDTRAAALTQQRRPDHCPLGVPSALLQANVFVRLTGICMELLEPGLVCCAEVPTALLWADDRTISHLQS